MIEQTKRLSNVLLRIVILATMILSSMTVVTAAAAVTADQPKTQPTSYRTVTTIEDWGAATTKVIIDLGNPVKEGAIEKDTFSVFVSRSDKRLATPFIESGYRTVTNAYVSDANGKPEAAGKYATLEMQIGPAVSLGSPLNYSNGSNVWIDCEYAITQLKDIPFGSGAISGILVNKFAGEIRELVDDFSFGKATYNDVTFSYADYSPKADSGKNPLIIWLHGGGEGGTDATIPLSANKSVNLITDEIQSYFGGAYVLVPQAPTRWMDGVTSRGDGTSIYEESIMALINIYVSNNNDIDTDRIYLGGCSNGGYLTMLMIRDYPDYFAAAFPVSEALKDSLITDTDLRNIMKTPIWFIDASTDTTTPPDLMTIPTYNRLIDAGAINAHLSIFPKVVDTSGLYKKADGTPYEYNGHWAWIYTYNNQCKATINNKEITIMEWLAAQSLND